MNKYFNDIFLEMKSVNKKFANCIQKRDFAQAKQFINEYKEKLPGDTRIYFLEALVSLEEGKIGQAKNELLEGINRIHPNYEVNYYINKANKNIQERDFLETLNNYERALALSENQELKKDLRDVIKGIEERYPNEIREQIRRVKENSKLGNELRFTNHIPNLHLFTDSIFCEKYIEFMNKNFDLNDHFFLVLCFEKELKYVKHKAGRNIKILFLKEGWEKCFEENTREILDYINLSDKIFIHYLNDFIAWLICRYDLNKNLYWIIWGGDLTNYININKYDELTNKFLNEKKIVHPDKKYMNTNEYVYRKATIRRVSGVLCILDEDFALLSAHFITGAAYIPFSYPNPIDYAFLENKRKIKSVKINYKKDFKYVIQLGNSGDPTNNHLDILFILKELKSDDFCVVCPLSYGNPQYINELIKEGTKVLGNKFIPLTEYLSTEEYSAFLNQVDVAIMNHNVPHGLGNILTLLYLGKKVYLKKQVSSYKSLTALGIKLFETNSLENNKIDEIFKFNDDDKGLNKKIVLDHFSEKNVIDYMNNIFNKN